MFWYLDCDDAPLAELTFFLTKLIYRIAGTSLLVENPLTPSLFSLSLLMCFWMESSLCLVEVTLFLFNCLGFWTDWIETSTKDGVWPIDLSLSSNVSYLLDWESWIYWVSVSTLGTWFLRLSFGTIFFWEDLIWVDCVNDTFLLFTCVLVPYTFWFITESLVIVEIIELFLEWNTGFFYLNGCFLV